MATHVFRVAVLAWLVASFPTDAATTHDFTSIYQAINLKRDTVPEPVEPVVIAVVVDAFQLQHSSLQGFRAVLPDELAGNGTDDNGNGVADDRSGWDVADGDTDVAAVPSDVELYHGTHVASILTAVARAAWGERASRFVKILPVKSIPDAATSTYLYNAWDGPD